VGGGRSFSDIYDARVSRDMISRITDKVVDEMNSWQTRPLDRVYPFVLIDAIYEAENLRSSAARSQAPSGSGARGGGR